jgi:hypothetical protein
MARPRQDHSPVEDALAGDPVDLKRRESHHLSCLCSAALWGRRPNHHHSLVGCSHGLQHTPMQRTPTPSLPRGPQGAGRELEEGAGQRVRRESGGEDLEDVPAGESTSPSPSSATGMSGSVATRLGCTSSSVQAGSSGSGTSR